MVIVALAVIDAAVAVIIAIASHGWQSQAMAGPLPSLFVVFHHDSGCGGWWGEGGARGGSWRPPLPPLTVDAVIVVVVVLTITWLRGGDEGGARGGSWRPPLPPLAVDAVIVVVAVAVFWKGCWQSQSSGLAGWLGLGPAGWLGLGLAVWLGMAGWLAGPGWLRAKPLLLDRRTRGLAGSSSSSSPSSSPPSLFMDPCTKANFTTKGELLRNRMLPHRGVCRG